MFRESDYIEPQRHSTYLNKPRSILQIESQLSKFDGITSNNVYNCKHELPPQVPVTYDTIHDPSHPDADWTGLVNKDRVLQKKHTNNHRSQQVGIIQTEEGIVSVEEKSEWSKLRRPTDSSYRGQSDLIGGIDTRDHYQTSYQRQINGVNTSQDQLTLVKRAGHRKNIPDPAQASSNSRTQQYDQSYNNNNNNNNNMESYSSYSSDNSMNGLSYRPQAMGGSLIKNLGSSLASRVAPPPSQHLSHSNDKTLILENFNNTPGYTGKRRPI